MAAFIFVQIPGPTTIIGFIVILLGIALVLADIAARDRDRASALDDTDRS